MNYFSIADCVVISCLFPFVFNFNSCLWSGSRPLRDLTVSLSSFSTSYICSTLIMFLAILSWNESQEYFLAPLTLIVLCPLRSAYSLFPESTESPCPDSGQRARHHHPQPTSQPPELGVSGGSCTLQTENDPMCVDKLTVNKTADIPTRKRLTHYQNGPM